MEKGKEVITLEVAEIGHMGMNRCDDALPNLELEIYSGMDPLSPCVLALSIREEEGSPLN